MSILSELRNAGLIVRPYPGWPLLTNKGRDRESTVGIVNHWDAIKGTPSADYYVHGNRFKALIYHIVVRRDGSVELLSQRYVYHAGRGARRVLTALRKGRVPPIPMLNVIVGNPYLFSVSVNYHPDEGKMSATQYNALVKVNRVLVKYFNLSVNQIIDHKGWTNRKRDIDTIDMNKFRQDVKNMSKVSKWAKKAWEKATKAELLATTDQPQETLTKEELMVFLMRAGVI